MFIFVSISKNRLIFYAFKKERKENLLVGNKKIFFLFSSIEQKIYLNQNEDKIKFISIISFWRVTKKKHTHALGMILINFIFYYLKLYIFWF